MTEQGFQLQRRGELYYLRSPLLDALPQVDHGFSTRRGGCSKGAIASLNLAFHTGDDPACVLENRRRFLAPWGYSPAEITAGVQVHSTGIAMVTAAERGRGAAPRSSLPDCDALVTAEPAVILTAYAADCLLLFLADPEVPVVALAHAGWRGTLEGMAGKITGYLEKECGASRFSLRAALSPAVCGQCYLVGEETAAAFRQKYPWATPFITPAAATGEYHLDLAAINLQQLREAGLREENIAPCTWCTSCRPDLFYSYRRDRGKTGRMMGFITLKQINA